MSDQRTLHSNCSFLIKLICWLQKLNKSQVLQPNSSDMLHHIHHVVNKGDAQCDKLVMVIGRTKLRTLGTINVPWHKIRKIGKFTVGQSLWQNYPYFWRCPNSLTTQLCAETSSIRPAISIEHWLVMDRQTHGHSMNYTSIVLHA